MAQAEVQTLTYRIKRIGGDASVGTDKLSNSLKRLESASGRTSRSVGSLLGTIQRIAKMMVLRQAIRGIINAMKEGVTNAYMFSKAIGGDLAAALDTLATKNFTATNQMGAAWASLLQAIQPVLLKIIELIRMAADLLTQFFALLGGKRTYLKAIDYSKEWAKTTSAGAAAAKEWKNQLMGFDEINRLEEPSSSSGGGGSLLPDYSQMFEEVPTNSRLTNLIDTLKAHLADLEIFAEGAMLGVGLILALTGANVPLGLGLIALGAYGLSKTLKEDWEYLTGNTMKSLMTIDNLIHGLEFGVGLILALSGANIPVGIGLMALGALGFARNAALNWEEVSDKTKKTIRDIEAAVGICLLGIGAILAFTGANIPLGIGLMIAGAGELAAAAALSEGGILTTVKRVLSEVMFVLGLALPAIGIILMALGGPAAWGLGISLIIAGLSLQYASMQIDTTPLFRFIDEVGAKIDSLRQKAANAVAQLNEFIKAGSYSESIGNGRSVSYSPNRPGLYAEGGFPDEGELFIARENNAPELVGRIGNSTAVANNDQIVAGIRQGVYEAVSQAMGNQRGGEVVLKLDGDVLAKGVTKYQRFQSISANI